MMRITLQREAGFLVFVLAGKLAGPWVKELEHCWRTAVGMQSMPRVRVDLSAVTFIDTQGKEILTQMYRKGADLAATGCLNRCIVDAIIAAGRD